MILECFVNSVRPAPIRKPHRLIISGRFGCSNDCIGCVIANRANRPYVIYALIFSNKRKTNEGFVERWLPFVWLYVFADKLL